MATTVSPPEKIRSRGLTTIRNLYTDWSEPAPQESVIDYSWYQPVRRWIVDHHLANSVIAAIKATHTAIFALIMGFIVYFAYAGLRGRATRWMAVTLLLTVIESLVLMVNRGRCPLTIVVEDLGDEHGSVSDIYLPGIVARHIPHISTGLLGLGIAGLLVRAGIRMFTR